MKYRASLTAHLRTFGFAALAGLMSQTGFAAEPSHLEHPHGAGTFMIEGIYMRMNMDGLRTGTDDVNSSDATSMTGPYKHMMVPTDMTMDMFMLMPMYNFTKDFSVMLMFNYLNNDMNMTGMCDTSMSTSGVGDTQAGFNYKFLDGEMAASLDLNIPTGSIDEKTKMKMMMNGMCMEMEMKAPYAMQLGSGTYDLTPSLTYMSGYYDIRYGAQISYKYRMGENDNNYTLGNEATAKLWIRKPAFGVTFSGELELKRWGDIEGKDAEINTMTQAMSMNGGAMTVNMKQSPTNYTTNYGGARADLTLGVDIPVSLAYVTADIILPLYQDLNGLQMKRSTSFKLGVGAMF